jgi:hypothetical protein
MIPEPTKRALPLSKFYNRMTLCKNENCINGGAWLVDGIPYCGKHAGAAALGLLQKEPFERTA